MEAQKKSFLTAPPSIEGVAAWISSPLPAVGANNAPLSSAPKGVDSASRVLCKSQSYTSWDCYARSYFGEARVRVPELSERNPIDAQPPRDPADPDIPTPQELAALSVTDRRKLNSKKFSFYRGVGVLSKTQVASKKYSDKIKERCAPSGCSNAPSTSTTGATPRLQQAQPSTSRQADAPSGSNAHHSTTRKAQKSETKSKSRTKSKTRSRPQTGSDEDLSEEGEERGSAIPPPSDGDPNPGPSAPQPISEYSKNPPRPNTIERPVEVGGPSVQAPPDTFYSDTIPVRCFNVTTYKTKREQTMAIPYSPTYLAYTQRMSDPASTGALGSVVRGPSIRDATSLASLCKYLQKDTGTYYEMAAIIRLACISLSVCPENYQSEIIQYRFLRDYWPNPNGYTSPSIVPPPAGSYHLNIVAMPLDVFLAFQLGKMNPVTVIQPPAPAVPTEGPWRPGRMDEYWTAVPARSEILGCRWFIPYMCSFLHSALWNGRVNWATSGQAKPNNEDPTEVRNVDMSFMPAASSVYVPGPKNIILVLVDSTAQYGSTFVNIWGDVNIPVYVGNTLVAQNMQPPDIIGTWDNWFSQANVGNITSDCNNAIMEINTRLSVENNTEISLSMSAEVYATLYNGLGVSPNLDNPTYNWQEPSFGGWKLTAAETLAPGSRLLCEKFEFQPDNTNARRRSVGYNFSSLTPLHRPPSGLSRTRPAPLPERDFQGRFWLGRYPDNQMPTYNISSMDSIYRVAVYLDLVMTHEQVLTFPHANALPGWIHMLSGALASQTAMVFAQNNLSLSVWTGYDTRFDATYSQHLVDEVIDAMTLGVVRAIPLTDIVQSWHNWDEDCIQEYFGIDPFDNDNWLSYSPIPFHLLAQWIEKMAYSYGRPPSVQSVIRHNAANHMGLFLTPETGQYRAMAVCTTDVDRYFPLVVFRQEDQPYSHMVAWVDNFNFTSNYASGSQIITTRSFLESQAFVLSPMNNALDFCPPLSLVVINSSYAGMTDDYKPVRVSPLQYPDPVTLKSILEGAKNYILYPAMSAIAGYVTGGVPGAVIAGGSHLAKNILENTTKGDTQEKAISVLKEMSREAEKQFVPQNIHTDNTHNNSSQAQPDAIKDQIQATSVITPQTSLEP